MNEADYRQLLRERGRTTIIALGLGVGGMVTWFGIVIAAGQRGAIWVLPAIAFFLGPIVVMGRRLSRSDYLCSHCGEDICARYEHVLTTRHCPACEQRFLTDGRERSVIVLSRLRRVRQTQFLRRWLWAWPALFAVVATCACLDPANIRK